jgi:opacity protein-like surface antigen
LFFHTEVNMKKLAVLAAVAMSTTAFAAAEHYGTIRGSYISATSTGSDIAPTWADEDDTSDYTEAAHTQLAFNQSRYGINFDGANIEFDLNGAGNPGGIQNGTSLRVRSAHMMTKFGSVDVTFGKAMSQMAGVNPTHFPDC